MATKNPLCLYPGEIPLIQELKAGDSLGGAAAGTNGTNGQNGGAITIAYTFSTTTTDADPGNGLLRLNNATQNSATTIFADLLDTGGTDWTTVIDTFDDSTNTTKGSIRLVDATDATKWLTFNVTAVTTATGYRKITISNTGSSASSPFSNGASLLLCFSRAGDKGTDGANGAAGTGFVQISSVTTASSQSTITFSSISGSYNGLRIILMGRDTSASVAGSNISMYFNADQTAANYTSTQNDSASGGSALVTQVASSTNGGVIARLPGTSSVATAFGVSEILIPFYANTTFHKGAIGYSFERFSTTTGVAMYVRGFAWLSTSAITSITLTAGGTAFLDGSRAVLYGMN